MASFDPSFIALRGTPEQTAAVAKDFKVFFAKVPGKRDDSYTMDHTAGSYVFDPAGRLRLFVRHGSGSEALTSDLKALLRSGLSGAEPRKNPAGAGAPAGFVSAQPVRPMPPAPCASSSSPRPRSGGSARR